MKKYIKILILKILKVLKTTNKEFQSLKLKDKKSIIIDQLFMGLSTIETLQLLDEVNQESKNRMIIQKKESLEVADAIAQHYKDDIIE
jgi:hypothetical protein